MSNTPTGVIPCSRYRVVHETRYAYQHPVTLSQQYLHMTPRSFLYQKADTHQIWIAPREQEMTRGIDYFGNSTQYMSITEPHKILLVHAESTVTLMQRPSLQQMSDSMSWETVRDLTQRLRTAEMLDACRYLYDSPHVQSSHALADYARDSFVMGRSHLAAAMELTQRIFDDFEFDGNATDISTPLEEVLKGRRGVCQDFAQLMLGCLRSQGLAARYVSGYILTHPPEGQPRMIGADASHAWVSVFSPEYGWVDFDPTNRCLVQSEHITLGWGRDFSDVTPMRGVVLGGGQQDLEVKVTVTPLWHDSESQD